MTVIIERNGVRYGQTTVQVPLDLKKRAKAQKISLSGLLTRALERELGEVSS